jgi:hypothetical protein
VLKRNRGQAQLQLLQHLQQQQFAQQEAARANSPPVLFSSPRTVPESLRGVSRPCPNTTGTSVVSAPVFLQSKRAAATAERLASAASQDNAMCLLLEDQLIREQQATLATTMAACASPPPRHEAFFQNVCFLPQGIQQLALQRLTELGLGRAKNQRPATTPSREA